jgi:hypothetical protein
MQFFQYKSYEDEFYEYCKNGELEKAKKTIKNLEYEIIMKSFGYFYISKKKIYKNIIKKAIKISRHYNRINMIIYLETNLLEK